MVVLKCLKCYSCFWTIRTSKAFRAEKRGLQGELERAREVEAAMRDEAEVHAVQLEALLAVKKALATEVGVCPNINTSAVLCGAVLCCGRNGCLHIAVYSLLLLLLIVTASPQPNEPSQ